MIERLKAFGAVNRIFADVAWVQSWRLELKPRGYEDENWYQETLANLGEVWQAVAGKPLGEVISANQGSVAEFDKEAVESLDKNKDDYNKFLGEIGVEAGGKAGRRITQSLRDYQALNAATLGSDAVQKARKRSYVWPLC